MSPEVESTVGALDAFSVIIRFIRPQIGWYTIGIWRRNRDWTGCVSRGARETKMVQL